MMKSFIFTFYSLTLLSASKAFSELDDYDIPMVKPEYLTQSSFRNSADTIESNDEDLYYVFLQRFPLQGTPFFHTEVLVCPREEFAPSDQSSLNDYANSISSSKLSTHEKKIHFVEIDESWWIERTSNCIELGYGGAACHRKCCGVPHGDDQKKYPINARRSMIGNADTSRKSLYLYGYGHFSGNKAYQDLCNKNYKKCWSNWSGFDYNLLKNNCNTFTSTVLSCVYGLSEEKPDLGVSDLVTVQCQCDQPGLEVIESLTE